jgi:predicted MFS family arabinose efflux permease
VDLVPQVRTRGPDQVEQLLPSVSEQRWGARLAVIAVAAAVAVSVIYLPQSLLSSLATDLGVPVGRAGLAATAVQAGYALGIVALVPLADRVHPRQQVTRQSLLLAGALALSAVLPGVASLALGFAVVGLVANIAQVLIPAASRLAPPGRAGATTATLVGSLSVGIFGGRILASLLVDLIGWRLVVVVFAAIVLATVPFVRRALDTELEMAADRVAYPRLLADTVALVRRSPELWQSGLMQFFVFATFNSIWTVMVLHLTSEPYGWSVRAAGLFGLVGIAAALSAPLAGRLLDRHGSLPVAGVALVLILLATATVILDSRHLVVFGLSMFVATAASQGHQSAQQNRILAANPGRAAQANTMFMFFVFLGGSVGAFVGPAAYGAGGMPRVAGLGCVFLVLALAVWVPTALRGRRLAAGAPAATL